MAVHTHVSVATVRRYLGRMKKPTPLARVLRLLPRLAPEELDEVIARAEQLRGGG
jgi:hypothetical protein